MCVQRVLDKHCEAFGVIVLRTDSYKQLKWLIFCLHPSECIEGFIFSYCTSQLPMCIQIVFFNLYEALEVVVVVFQSIFFWPFSWLY